MIFQVCLIAWFVYTKSFTCGKPLLPRMRRSSENDHLQKTVDDAANIQFTSFQVPTWMQFYKTVFDNIVDDKILPEIVEPKIAVSSFYPRGTVSEVSFDLSPEEDTGESNILSNDGMSDWELNTLGGLQIPDDNGQDMDVGASDGIDVPEETKVKMDVTDDMVSNFDQTMETGENIINDDSLDGLVGLSWGMIKRLRESADEINSFESDTGDQANADSEVLNSGGFGMPETDMNEKDDFENTHSDSEIIFDDIHTMLDEESPNNIGDVNILPSPSLPDELENGLGGEWPEPTEPIDSTIEVGGIEFPSGDIPEVESKDVAPDMSDDILSSSDTFSPDIDSDSDLQGDGSILENNLEIPSLEEFAEINSDFEPSVKVEDVSKDTEFSSDIGFYSIKEMSKLNDETNMELTGGSDDSNVDSPFSNDISENISTLKTDDTLFNDNPFGETQVNDVASEVTHTIDELVNDEQIT